MFLCRLRVPLPSGVRSVLKPCTCSSIGDGWHKRWNVKEIWGCSSTRTNWLTFTMTYTYPKFTQEKQQLAPLHFSFRSFALQLNWSVHKCIHKSYTKTLVSCSRLSNLLVFSSCHVIYVAQTSCTLNSRGFGRDTILKQVNFHQLLSTSHNDMQANCSWPKLASLQKVTRLMLPLLYRNIVFLNCWFHSLIPHKIMRKLDTLPLSKVYTCG